VPRHDHDENTMVNHRKGVDQVSDCDKTKYYGMVVFSSGRNHTKNHHVES
jgi:hypothetical protein